MGNGEWENKTVKRKREINFFSICCFRFIDIFIDINVLHQKRSKIKERNKLITRKEMSFEEQIMFKDKYTSTFSRRIEAIMFLNQSNILQRVKKMFTNSSLFSAWDVFSLVFSGTAL